MAGVWDRRREVPRPPEVTSTVGSGTRTPVPTLAVQAIPISHRGTRELVRDRRSILIGLSCANALPAAAITEVAVETIRPLPAEAAIIPPPVVAPVIALRLPAAVVAVATVVAAATAAGDVKLNLKLTSEQGQTAGTSTQQAAAPAFLFPRYACSYLARPKMARPIT
jgi:hypothetical protein